MKLETSFDGQTKTLSCAIGGEFTYNNADQFKQIYASYEKDELDRVRIDLADTSYIDSTGLGALVIMRATLGKKVSIELLDANPNVRQSLRYVNIQRFFKLNW